MAKKVKKKILIAVAVCLCLAAVLVVLAVFFYRPKQYSEVVKDADGIILSLGEYRSDKQGGASFVSDYRTITIKDSDDIEAIQKIMGRYSYNNSLSGITQFFSGSKNFEKRVTGLHLSVSCVRGDSLTEAYIGTKTGGLIGNFFVRSSNEDMFLELVKFLKTKGYIDYSEWTRDSH